MWVSTIQFTVTQNVTLTFTPSLMRLLDRRFAGVARGVGTAQILGRVHSAQLKLADLYLPCSFTVMEGRDVDLLFGLDMLKAHQACIDLEKDCLRIQGREVRFLAEHELPEKARSMNAGLPDDDAPPTSVATPPQPSASGSGPAGATHFPGSGHALGAAPAGAVRGQPVVPTQGGHPETAINTLMGLGATRELEIQTLDAANGNVDFAASLLF